MTLDELHAERTTPATEKPFVVRNPDGRWQLILRSEVAARAAWRFYNELFEDFGWEKYRHAK